VIASVAGNGYRLAVPQATADVDLHRRVVAGDETALGEIYDRFAMFLHAVAYRVTRDRDAASDVVQEIFVQVWEHPLAYDPARGSMRTWLAMIAHRRAVDWVRREERHRRVTREHTADIAPPDIQPAADAELQTTETIREVRRTVSALPERLREAVELAFFRGLTYRQVAIELGIPEGTAKSRMRTALRQLAVSLAEEGMG
jgi:RNA polymerase sigma-70 factor (ECF subfamily)